MFAMRPLLVLVGFGVSTVLVETPTFGTRRLSSSLRGLRCGTLGLPETATFLEDSVIVAERPPL